MSIEPLKRFRPEDELSKLTPNEALIERTKVENAIRACRDPKKLIELYEYHERVIACGPFTR